MIRMIKIRKMSFRSRNIMETPLQVGAYSPDNWAWDGKQEMWLRVQQLCRGQRTKHPLDSGGGWKSRREVMNL